MLAERACIPRPHIQKSALAHSLSILQNSLQTAAKGQMCPRAFHTLHERPLLQAPLPSSAAAACSSPARPSISHAARSYTALTRQQPPLSGRCCSLTPAFVRRWRPGSAHVGSSLLKPSGSSGVRAFSSQAQRSQQRRQLQKKSSEQGVYLVALVVGMVGLTYASVPLYRCAAGCTLSPVQAWAESHSITRQRGVMHSDLSS